MTELQGIPFGNLIVELIGADTEVRRTLDYLNQQEITIKEVNSYAS